MEPVYLFVLYSVLFVICWAGSIVCFVGSIIGNESARSAYFLLIVGVSSMVLAEITLFQSIMH